MGNAGSLSWITNSANGIHAKGEIGFRTWMNGSSARYINGDIPIKKPRRVNRPEFAGDHQLK